MTTLIHTKNEWKAHTDNKQDGEYTIFTGESRDNFEAIIASVAGGLGFTGDECFESEANARLISAAPDLLNFTLSIAKVIMSSGHNLCSTATQEERSAFISGVIDAWNYGGSQAIDKAIDHDLWVRDAA